MAKSGHQAVPKNVYVLTVYLANAQTQRTFVKAFSKNLVIRTIEMRGDQTPRILTTEGNC